MPNQRNSQYRMKLDISPRAKTIERKKANHFSQLSFLSKTEIILYQGWKKWSTVAFYPLILFPLVKTQWNKTREYIIRSQLYDKSWNEVAKTKIKRTAACTLLRKSLNLQLLTLETIPLIYSIICINIPSTIVLPLSTN